MREINYSGAILEGFKWLLQNDSRVFAIGQGLWSPWYVGNTMKNLEHEFGKDRLIDTPVSELAVTGAAVGAAISGMRPIVIHPRMDFFLLGADALVNQAAKWRYMFNNNSSAPVTVRAIINRGGEQGAQHSQSLHSWFAHIPGLRVVMPATPSDARDLLISATLSDDPVLYVDDRWLYDEIAEIEDEIKVAELSNLRSKILLPGNDVTLVAAGWAVKICAEAAKQARDIGITCEVVDLRQVNPIDHFNSIESVRKTGRLIAVDGGWSNCGLAAEIVAGVSEAIPPTNWRNMPARYTLQDTPAPAADSLEDAYYPSSKQLTEMIKIMVSS